MKFKVGDKIIFNYGGTEAEVLDIIKLGKVDHYRIIWHRRSLTALFSCENLEGMVTELDSQDPNLLFRERNHVKIQSRR